MEILYSIFFFFEYSIQARVAWVLEHGGFGKKLSGRFCLFPHSYLKRLDLVSHPLFILGFIFPHFRVMSREDTTKNDVIALASGVRADQSIGKHSRHSRRSNKERNGLHI